MRIAAITMVRDEAVFLPLWIAHYGAQLGRENLFVVDHGSTDGSTDALCVNTIRLPPSDLDEKQRVVFVSRFHASLLTYYDVVIYTDADEFLVADPARHANLQHFLDTHTDQAIAARGVNVLHDTNAESDLDLSRPPLAQRSWVRFDPLYCKPLIARRPMNWGIGFHRVDGPVKLAADLTLFHLRLIDFRIFSARQIVRQGVTMSAEGVHLGHNNHFGLSIDRCRALWFENSESNLSSDETLDFTFDKACRRMLSKDNVSITEMWPTARIPSRYKTAIAVS